jgi:hypothetical protein
VQISNKLGVYYVLYIQYSKCMCHHYTISLYKTETAHMLSFYNYPGCFTRPLYGWHSTRPYNVHKFYNLHIVQMSMCVFEVIIRLCLCLHLCLKGQSKEMKVYPIISVPKFGRVLIVFNIFIRCCYGDLRLGCYPKCIITEGPAETL